MPDLSIAIVNFQDSPVIRQCLDSIMAGRDGLEVEIIVVNNACSEASVQDLSRRYPQVKLINRDERLGFSTNNNLAMEQAQGRYWMLLNDDTIVQSGTLQALVSFLDGCPRAGVAGANLFYPDGRWQVCYGNVPNPVYEGLRPLSEMLMPVQQKHGAAVEVVSVCGAGMAVRAEAARQVGLLDAAFDPGYSEEVDWCYRMWKAGWKVYHLPEAGLIHLGGASFEDASRRSAPGQRFGLIYEKKALFFRKHFGRLTVMSYKACLFCANLGKAAFWGLRWLLESERRLQAKEELCTHWDMTRRALFL